MATGYSFDQLVKTVIEPLSTPDFYLPLEENLTIMRGKGIPYQIDVSNTQDGSVMADLPIYKAFFTRASKATYINKQGFLAEANIDEPRFEKEGILIEGESTNLVSTSGAEGFPDQLIFSTEEKELINSELDTVAAKYIIDKPASSDIMVKVNNNSSIAEEKYTVSIFIKVIGMVTWRFRYAINNIFKASIYFESTDTETTLKGNDYNLPINIKKLNHGWFRVEGTFMPDENGDLSIGFYTNISGVETDSSLLLFGYQVEAKKKATSYIPTVGNIVSRAKDIIILDSSAIKVVSPLTISFWYQHLASRDSSSSYPIFNSSGKSNIPGGFFRFYYGGEDNTGVRMSRNFSKVANPTFTDGRFHLLTVTVTNNRQFDFVDSIMVNSNSDPLILDPLGYDDIVLGNTDAFFHIKDFRIWNRRLTDTEIAQIHPSLI